MPRLNSVKIENYIGKWSTIEFSEIKGKIYHLLESDTWGDEVGNLLVNEHLEVIDDECFDSMVSVMQMHIDFGNIDRETGKTIKTLKTQRLSARAFHYLKLSGYSSIEHLEGVNISELLKTKGLGFKCITEYLGNGAKLIIDISLEGGK